MPAAGRAPSSVGARSETAILLDVPLSEPASGVRLISSIALPSPCAEAGDIETKPNKADTARMLRFIPIFLRLFGVPVEGGLSVVEFSPVCHPGGLGLCHRCGYSAGLPKVKVVIRE
jgi:hypothetical protein